MENQNDNKLHELDELKQQYESFSQTLKGQKIMGSDEVGYVVNHSRDYFHQHRRNVMVGYLVGMLLLLVVLGLFKANLAFSVIAVLLLLVGMFTELWLIKDLVVISQTGTPLQLAQRLFEAKGIFLVYYITLFISLMLISFLVAATMDLPPMLFSLRWIVMMVPFAVLLSFVFMNYLPFCGQCNTTLKHVAAEVDSSRRFSRGLKFFGITILFFAAITAVLKMFHLPGGTLAMLVTFLWVIVYSFALAIWLHRRRSFPILLGLLMAVAISLMSYLVMARINCWPPMRHLDNYSHFLQERATDDSTALGQLAIMQVCPDIDQNVAADLQKALAKVGVECRLLEECDAFLAVAVSDTAQTNRIIAACESPLLKDSTVAFCWSLPDCDGQSMLYALSKSPVVSGSKGEAPLLSLAEIEYLRELPHSLTLYLTPYAEEQWQAAVFRIDQQCARSKVAVVFDGEVLCLGAIDHDNLGYEQLTFELSPSSSVDNDVIVQLVRN